MARTSRDESRADLTARAQAQGVEVAPGQLEAAGLAVMDPPEVADDQEPEPYTGSVFFRVKIVNSVVNEPGAHNHVVRAPDKANAWETFRKEMGVIAVDESVNRREISPASELDYIQSQARRLRVDLREHRQVPEDKIPKGGDKGRVRGFFPLTWQGAGPVVGQYLINEKGEVKPAEGA